MSQVTFVGIISASGILFYHYNLIVGFSAEMAGMHSESGKWKLSNYHLQR